RMLPSVLCFSRSHQAHVKLYPTKQPYGHPTTGGSLKLLITGEADFVKRRDDIVRQRLIESPCCALPFTLTGTVNVIFPLDDRHELSFRLAISGENDLFSSRCSLDKLRYARFRCSNIHHLLLLWHKDSF